MESPSNQLVNKFVISLPEGKILGFVTDINVEVSDNQYYFILRMKVFENLSRGEFHPGMFSSEKKIKIKPEDIVNVGPDVIILGDGKVPPLREIERLVHIAEEYNALVKELEKKEEEIKKLKEENKELQKIIEELERKVKRLEVIEDDFGHLKEQLLKQEGQLEMAREYIKLLEGIRHDIDEIRNNITSLISGYIEEVMRKVVNEELNARGLKKTII
ncbi:hypothetical protein PFDSM3638_10175 [Pyrococcus furiosus DSM 3638]|uniref:PRC-barrel domain-containing protein n=3 Tax=Pyrococcus furiosus TaxID=2261 RepID=Q8TZH6_PYRFU|nr:MULTISPECIES: hypothetical protein [Pyrococcus]AAL82141.1 hypothetical protein PF2017 [Pyrococcus furiosus DSM 3638]AFN04625.1 hypothetical protein PFC_08475 [Pyrococcus furiosus COM1]MDK2869577.1 preprotein translocase subunit SecG [Pyrococcus sp.]QEK79611.1 hypothetical protein PFDSM3638_10175 [Pyrococcus furiosus DSM 3638]